MWKEGHDSSTPKKRLQYLLDNDLPIIIIFVDDKFYRAYKYESLWIEGNSKKHNKLPYLSFLSPREFKSYSLYIEDGNYMLKRTRKNYMFSIVEKNNRTFHCYYLFNMKELING